MTRTATTAEWETAPAPPGARATAGKYDWPTIVADLRRLAQDQPGDWAKVPDLDGAPVTTAIAIRGRRMAAIKQVNDGVVQVRVRNTRTNEQGVRVGTLWMRFMPHPTQEDNTDG